MHQSHQQQQQQQQSQQIPQSQPHQSHNSNAHTPNHQQQHHHPHHQGPMNQQQHHQMHHSQAQQQGPPLQQQPQPQQPQQHHPQQISHHHAQHPHHQHPHHHNHHNHNHHHNPNQHQHHPAQQQQQHSSHQQQSAVSLPSQQPQHPQHPLPVLSGPHHSTPQTQVTHQLSQAAHHTHHPLQQQHQSHHPHQHGAPLPHAPLAPHGAQQQPQHGPHSGQHSQAQPTQHHGLSTGAVQQQQQQQHRQQHQHAHAHHQHHPQPSQQPHHMPPPTYHHHLGPHPHAAAAAHQMMMNHAQYNPALVYHVNHQFQGGPPGPPAFNQNHVAAATGHRPDTATVGLNSQQQQQQSTGINQTNLQQQQQLNQMTPPVISSTTATGTTNVHHHTQASNGPVLDPNLHRLPPYLIHPQFGFLPPPYSHHQGSYHPNQMQPSPNMMMPHRLPTDHLGHVRPPFDPQTHANMAAKVPLTQPPIIGAKPSGPMSMALTPSGITPTPSTLLQKRKKTPALIKHPTTGQQVTLEELEGSTGSSVKVQNASSTLESPTLSTATTMSTTTAPSAIPTTSEQATSDTIATTPVIASVSSEAIAKGDPIESLDANMKNLSLDNAATGTTVITPTPSGDANNSPTNTDTLPSPHISPKIVSTSSNSASRLQTVDPTQLSERKVLADAEQVTTTSHLGSVQESSVSEASMPSIDSKENIEPHVGKEQAVADSVDEPDRAIKRDSGPVNESINSVISEKPNEAISTNSFPEEPSKVTSDEPKTPEKPEKKQLNLPYQPGQYSPLNPEGRKKYTHEFLLAVHEMMKPELDQIGFNSQNYPRVDIMAPSFINAPTFASSCRDPPISRRSSQQAVSRPKKIIATSSLQPEVELKTSENAWKPELEKEKSKAVETGEMDTTRLLKVFRGHLNKLTPQKYDSIIEKVGALDLDGPERLTSVIDLVFDKAVDEPGFCELYAKMCKVIAQNHQAFFYHLVKKCQEEFETSDLYNGLNVDARKENIEKESDAQKKKLLSEELYEDMRLRRKKYLGTIKLIGEMYKFGLLIPKIIGLCMKHLIEGASNENLECLCSLLATVGAKMASENEEIIKQSLANTLKVLHDFAHSKKFEDQFVLESRVKFKILDTIDLSRKNWKPRMVENNPKKIEEIREEVKEDKLRQQNHLNQNRNSLKNDDRDRHRRLGNNSYGKNQNSKWN